MSTKDDALVQKIEDSIRHSLHWSLSNREIAERVLAVARKAIREEDAAVCSSRAKEWADSYGDGSKDWAKRSMISAAEADRCAAAIRSLATQEQHND